MWAIQVCVFCSVFPPLKHTWVMSCTLISRLNQKTWCCEPKLLPWTWEGIIFLWDGPVTLQLCWSCVAEACLGSGGSACRGQASELTEKQDGFRSTVLFDRKRALHIKNGLGAA